MEWRLEERATGAEDPKKAERLVRAGKGAQAWTQQETRGDERVMRKNGRWSNGSSESEMEKERERRREREKGEKEKQDRRNCWRVPWNAVGREEDRRKQAAIVSDDSLVATHVTLLASARDNHPLSVFLSFMRR